MDNKNERLRLIDSIEKLGLPIKIQTILFRYGIKDINTLIHRYSNPDETYKRPHLLSIRNLGQKSLSIIKEKVHLNGFLFIDEDGFEELIKEINIELLYQKRELWKKYSLLLKQYRDYCLSKEDFKIVVKDLIDGFKTENVDDLVVMGGK